MADFRKLLDTLESMNEELMEVNDSFDLEINDELLIETGIVGFTEDGVILEADDKVLELLSKHKMISESFLPSPEKPPRLKDLMANLSMDELQQAISNDTYGPEVRDWLMFKAEELVAQGKLKYDWYYKPREMMEILFKYLQSDASAGGSYKLDENWDDEGTVPTEEMIDIIKRPFLTNNMMEKVGNVIGKYGPVRITAAIEDYASGLYWPRGQGINSKDPWHWAYAVIKTLESGNYDEIDSVPVRKEVEITLPDWVRENSDQNQDSVALEEEKEMDLEQSRAELRRDPTTRAAAQAIIKAITTDCEPSSYCIDSLTMTYSPEAIIKSLYSTASASEPEDIASPEAIDKLVQKFVRSLKYNAGELTEEQELDDKRIKEIKEKIEFYKLMGNEKAAAELEGMLRAGAISSATLKEESKDKSSVSMPARKLYTQTYAKQCKTAKDSKKAEQLAYAAVEKKYGSEVLSALKKHHSSNQQGVAEGYAVTRGIDRERYQERPGLEGPFSTKSGKVVYYDKVEGKYYDPDTDMYIEYDDWKAMNEQINEAKYRGRTVSLNKPTKGDVKKRKVYVRKPNGNVVKVEFGDPNMRIKKSNPARRKSFRARHRCDNPGPKWKARYWSCRFW